MSEELPAVTLARIEGKLDLLHASIQSAQLQGADHEARIRTLEARPAGITPAKLLSSFVGVAAVASATASFVTLMTR